MRFVRYFLPLLFFIVTSALGNGSASGALMNIESFGKGVYKVQGVSLENIAGSTIIVYYQDTSLSNPVVDTRAGVFGGLINSNTNIKGQITIAGLTLSPVSSGTIATITFDVKGTNPPMPKLKVIDAVSHDSKLGTIDVGEGVDSSGKKEDKKNDEKIDTNNPPPPPTGITYLGGNITFPTDTPTDTKKDQPKQTDIAQDQRPGSPSDAKSSEQQSTPPPKEKEPKFVAYKGTLERFKEYDGERTPKLVLGLFAPALQEFKQEPPVFIADGEATLKVVISVPPTASSAPNVAVSKEAQLISFNRGEDGVWVVELKPKKGVNKVLMTHFIDETTTDIPLTVAPRIDTFNGKPFEKMTEADLVQFLARKEEVKGKINFDLNNDKVVNYIDDFIFAANYLVRTPMVKSTDKKEIPPVKPSELKEKKTK